MRRDAGGEHAHGCLAAQADAVGNADAVVGVARKCQSRQRGHVLVDALHAILVADGVLRHGAAPAVYLHVLRFDVRADDARAENLAQLAANRGDEDVVGLVHHLFLVHAAEECAQHRLARSRAADELAVREGAGQQGAAGACRHQESKAFGKLADLRLVEDQIHGDGR